MYGRRHSSGWVEFCDDDDPPHTDVRSGLGSLGCPGTAPWQEDRDEFVEACICMVGFLAGAVVTSAIWVWWLFL